MPFKPTNPRLFKVLLETLGPEEIPTALFLLAEKCCQNDERSKVTNAEFGADLLSSFSLSIRLKVCRGLRIQLILGYRVLFEISCMDSS